MDARKSLQTIVSIAKELGETIEENKRESLKDTQNGKTPRFYNQREAIDAIQSTKVHKRSINQVCDELDIAYDHNGKWRVNLAQVQQLRAHVGHLVHNKSHLAKVIATSSLKGGSGKTTAAINIATGLATEPTTLYNVLVIDLDPQGTATTYLKPNMSNDEFSIGDLLIGDFELDEGETFEDACLSSCYETNHPNLKVLPARDNDRKYELESKQREIEANKNGEEYFAYKDLERVIDAVKSHFDIIIIDTPPQFSAVTLSAHYVADSLILPLKPSENDRDASSKYVDFLASAYQVLMGLGHQGYDSIKVLLSGVKNNSTTQKQLLRDIRFALKYDCFEGQFSEREAVSSCAKHYCSIYDISGSDYEFGSVKKTLVAAQQEFKVVINEIEADLIAAWGEK